MKIIKGQIVASTNIDAHGEKRTKEELSRLFEQMPKETLLNKDHNLALPPIAKMFNKQLVEIENGEFAIKADIEIFDEESAKDLKGFSISFTNKVLTLNPERKPEIEILYNPLDFDKDDVIPIIQLSNESFQIDLVEHKQKALEPLTCILILNFIGISIAAGFFGKFGEEIYEVIKKKLLELIKKYKSQKHKDILFHVKFPAELNGRLFELIVEVSEKDFDIIDQQNIRVEQAIMQIEDIVGTKQIQKVALRIQEIEPYWKIIYIVDVNNNLIKK